MRYTLLLAWRYTSYHRGRSILLAACILSAALLPLAVQLLVHVYGKELAARADATPLVVGGRGSRYDLVLSGLYFRGRVPQPTSMAETRRIQESGLALPIPVLARRTAADYPVVGTTPDYLRFRSLLLERGTPFLFIGDAVLGARVARELRLGPGDHLLTDRGSLYDLAAGYPLRLSVTGVLAETGTPDDRAVFVDVKTAWIIEGIGHGHEDATAAGEGTVLEERGDTVVLNASVREHVAITPDNIDSFHFHGAPESFPLTAVLVVPKDAKSATLLKGRYRVAETAQLLVPSEVVEEMLAFVFRIKAFFDANFLLVAFSTSLFLVLVVLLNLRIRRRELDLLRNIGCSTRAIFRIVGTELLLTVGAGLAGALVLAGLLVWSVERGYLAL